MKHKHAELLIAAAEDADALFKCDSQLGRYDIYFVLTWPEKNWQLVKKPVVEVEYYGKLLGGYRERWDMKVTITDGVRKAEFK